MSIRKQTRKSRSIGMLFSAPQTLRVTPPTSVCFCSRRQASQSSGSRHYSLRKAWPRPGFQQFDLREASRSDALQRHGGGAAYGLLVPEIRPVGPEWIFAGASTAKVMLNRGMTAVPSDRDWITSAWLTKRRQTLARLNVTQEV